MYLISQKFVDNKRAIPSESMELALGISSFFIPKLLFNGLDISNIF